jgi:hypothetical protein
MAARDWRARVGCSIPLLTLLVRRALCMISEHKIDQLLTLSDRMIVFDGVLLQVWLSVQQYAVSQCCSRLISPANWRANLTCAH